MAWHWMGDKPKLTAKERNIYIYTNKRKIEIECKCAHIRRIHVFYIRAPRATGAVYEEFMFFTFGPRGRRARSARRPRGQNVAAIALDMGQAHLWYENNTMQTIHAIQTLRTVCGFLDMGDGCCLIFNKNQLMFIVRKSITAQIKKKNHFVLFVTSQDGLKWNPSLCHHSHSSIWYKNCKTVPFTKTENGSVSSIWWKCLAGSFRHDGKNMEFCYKENCRWSK